MHLISTIPGGWNPNDDGVFYIEQKPGDILFLSAADTDLHLVNKAYHSLYKSHDNLPSLRLANLTYFKQELTIDTYIDEVVSKAKVVVLKLLGGMAYFSYLCEALTYFAEENDIQLIFLPGDDKPDLELMQLSTLSLQEVDRIWNYLIAVEIIFPSTSGKAICMATSVGGSPKSPASQVCWLQLAIIP